MAGPGPDLHLDRVQAANPALPDHLHGEAVGGGRAALRPGLVDRAETAAGVHQLAALTDGERDRLLAVNVLAGARGVDGTEPVPAVAGGDGNGVHVLARQQLAEIRVGGAVLVAVIGVHLLLRGLQPVGPAIAHGDVLDFGEGKEGRQRVQGAVADPDGAEDNAIARRRPRRSDPARSRAR